MASPSRNNVVAVVVTYRRAAELAQSLQIVAAQTVAPNHLVVVDNDNDPAIKTLVEGQPIATTYLGSNRNLGGAGGFALGMLHALTLGADWVWLADDDGRPGGTDVLEKLLACARTHRLAEVSPMVCDIDDPGRLAFPLRRGLVWRRRVDEFTDGSGVDRILDIMGAKYLSRNVDALGNDGHLVIIGMQGGVTAELNIAKLIAKRGSLTATTLRARPIAGPCGKAAIVESVAQNLWPLVEAGKVRPVVGAEIPLSQAAEAHRLLENGAVVGKVLLTR
ncbi:zinc-binding dehydrogenase [Mycobacteroides abscessus]|uniref:zinc-binding dehydrogenase n=1 Tax=Mycobacteroides abscessus TaxID=36809 RepID=UPI0039F10993